MYIPTIMIFAVGKINDTHDSEDDGQADADQGVYPADQDAADKGLQKKDHQVSPEAEVTGSRRGFATAPGWSTIITT